MALKVLITALIMSASSFLMGLMCLCHEDKDLAKKGSVFWVKVCMAFVFASFCSIIWWIWE